MNAETKHTPGRWYAQPNINQGNSWEICHGPEGRATLPATYANAQLIDAAPETAAERDRLRDINADLLAALKSLRETVAR